MDGEVQGAVAGMAWPAIPSSAGTAMLAMQWQLERSERLAPARLAEHQFRQLRVLVSHAVREVPYYAEHLRRAGVPSAEALDATSYLRWPILRTEDLQRHAGALRALTYPKDHGAVAERFTSGSSGTPKRILDTQAASFYKDALVLREHLWHRRDLTAKFAGIHFFAEPGAHAGWNPAINVALKTGPGVVNNVGTDVAAQWSWLLAEKPAYLLTTPSNLAALVRHGVSAGQAPRGLRQVMTYSEPLTHGLREAVAGHWGVTLADTYSCTEAGALALQCPDAACYHVQSENVYLEVLQADGAPCRAGEAGRVVITPLHNFAMPLLRYDLGDFAVPGNGCGCGRGLPVLASVVGRVRNMARDPSGRLFQPGFDAALDEARTPISQFQFVQEAPDLVEMSYVLDRDLSEEEMRRFSAAVEHTVRYPFRIRYRRVQSIARGPGGKYEGFISRLT